MVLVSFSKEVLEDAKQLTQFEPEVLTEFCSISVDHLQSGSISKSKFTKAAESLQVEIGTLVVLIQALSHLLLEGAKRNCSPDDFIQSLDEIPFQPEQKESIKSSFGLHFRSLRSLLSDLSLRLPHYHNLEWRLDIQLSSKLMRNQVEPILLLELETKNSQAESEKQMLQLDYANLDHLVKQLENAVKEVNTKHARRIIRYVK